MKLPVQALGDHEGLGNLVEILGAGEGHIRYVGGVVRDGLLGMHVVDIDCATLLAPEEVMRRLQDANIKAVPTGIAHGTVTAVLPSGAVEITTLRRDVSTDGRRATIAYSTDWREDAARRDFTINALYADPLTREIADYFGGMEDLRAGRVRFIGDPLARIAEDHLRILRFFRFHARFGRGAPEERALSACIARANDLMALSRERVAMELLNLLGLPDPGPTVALMESSGIFRPIIPEISAQGVARLQSLISAERRNEMERNAIRRLAALLPPEPELAEQIGQRLRISNALRKRLILAVGWTEGKTTGDDPRRLAWDIGTAAAVDRLLIAAAGQADSRIALLNAWERPRFGLSGKHLIARGVRPGPEVARLLQDVERQWVDEGFPNDARVEAIADAIVLMKRD